jgi:NADPH-dependent 2,4-dienoyl-CoA reductase/sulfur reductase-like enzyme
VTGTVAIVGASVAGVRTAQALRTEGHAGPVILIGAEPGLPYDKPPLSKQFLAGTWSAEKIVLLSREAAQDQGIELRLGVPAAHLDVARRSVLLADGERVSYDMAVIATGADARPSPWRPASGLHVVRTLEHSRDLRAGLAAQDSVVIVGGGFIGSEVAATARAGGREVTVVDPLVVPMGRLLGAETGALFESLHHRHGVRTRFGVGVQDVAGTAGSLRVTLTDGEVLRAGTVVVGIGARPGDAWLASSGLLVDDGVVCDQYCRAVDAPEVWAAGDVARWFHPRYGESLRVEHWTNAADQAACVAHNIAHPDELQDYRPTEYIWSDQYDWRIQMVGRPHRGTEVRLLGDPGASRSRFAALYGDDAGQLVGALTVNWPRALVTCRRLAQADTAFSAACGQVGALASTAPPGGTGAGPGGYGQEGEAG